MIVGAIIAIALFRVGSPKKSSQRDSAKNEPADNSQRPSPPEIPVHYVINATIHHHSSNGPNDQEGAQNNQHLDRSSPWTSSGFYLAIGTIAMAVGTGFLAFYSFKQVGVISDNGKKQLRAYVLASQATMTTPDEMGNSTVKVVFKNYGQTPAYECTQKTTFDVWDEVNNKLYEKGKSFPEETSHANVGAADIVTVESIATLSQNRIKEMNDKKFTLWVHGTFTFTDIFEHEWHGEFSFKSDPNIGAKAHKFLVTEKGNNVEH